MQSFIIRGIIIILLIFPFTSFGAYTELYPTLTKSVSADLNFTIYCTDYLNITKIYQRYGSQTTGTVFDLITPGQTVRATTTGASGVLEFSFTGIKCNPSSSISATLDFISGDSSWVWYRLPTVPYGITIPYNQNLIYADASEASYWFPQGYDYQFQHVTVVTTGSSSSSTMTTTTVITANDQLIQFFILFTFMFMLLFGIIYLAKPFYARK